MQKIDENKLFKQAKEFWQQNEEVLKMMYGCKNFDEYFLKIKDQHHMFYSLPDEERDKFINAQLVMVSKYYREMVRDLNKKYGEK